MNISFDLSSKIENRIDQELFQNDSDDLSLPGMSRRASMTHSTSDLTGLLRSPATNDPVETNPGFQEHMNDESVSNSTGHNDQVSDELQQLDERLLDESDSLRLSPKREQELEISESTHREIPSADDNFMSQGEPKASALASCEKKELESVSTLIV